MQQLGSQLGNTGGAEAGPGEAPQGETHWILLHPQCQLSCCRAGLSRKPVKDARNIRVKPEGRDLLGFSHNYFSFPFFFFISTTFKVGFSKPPILGLQVF